MNQIDYPQEILVQSRIGCFMDDMLKSPSRVQFEEYVKLDFWKDTSIFRQIVLQQLFKDMYHEN